MAGPSIFRFQGLKEAKIKKILFESKCTTPPPKSGDTKTEIVGGGGATGARGRGTGAVIAGNSQDHNLCECNKKKTPLNFLTREMKNVAYLNLAMRVCLI